MRKSSTANVLIVVGGGLIAAPLAFMGFAYFLSARLLSEAIANNRMWDKVNFHPAPPDYYIPMCLMAGIFCIIAGILLSLQRRNAEPQSSTLFNLDDFRG